MNELWMIWGICFMILIMALCVFHGKQRGGTLQANLPKRSRPHTPEPYSVPDEI